MSAAKYVDPPYPIMDVLDALLAAMRSDGRFGSIPNGRLEGGWKQARHGRDASPPRYSLTVECSFKPRAAGDPE